MKRMIKLMTVVTALSCLLPSCQRNGQPGKVPPVQGDYLGQAVPGDTARLFAPGIISTGMNDRDFAITPDGNEIFFCRDAGNFRYSVIFHTQRTDGVCQSRRCSNTVPTPVHTLNRTFPLTGKNCTSSPPCRQTLPWMPRKISGYVRGQKGKWSAPVNLGAPVNTPSREFYPSVTIDGTIYYSHLDTIAGEEFIYRSRLKDGVYQQPEKLPGNVNTGRARYNPFVAADESYIIIPAYGMPDSFGATDYYISFRDSLDNWSQPINMGPQINSANPREWSASVTTDGKYIFFMSDRPGGGITGQLSRESMQEFHNTPQNGNTDVYWISSRLIEELRAKAIF
ncbi:MAG: hypothetical protein R2758_13905 [Bacteroidales bacterium]